MKIINKFDVVILLTTIFILSAVAIEKNVFLDSFVLGILVSIPIILIMVYVILTQDLLTERNMKILIIFCVPLGLLISLIINIPSVETYLVSVHLPKNIILSLGIVFSVTVWYELISRYASSCIQAGKHIFASMNRPVSDIFMRGDAKTDSSVNL